jgi:hypothetical protein
VHGYGVWKEDAQHTQRGVLRMWNGPWVAIGGQSGARPLH